MTLVPLRSFTTSLAGLSATFPNKIFGLTAQTQEMSFASTDLSWLSLGSLACRGTIEDRRLVMESWMGR